LFYDNLCTSSQIHSSSRADLRLLFEFLSWQQGDTLRAMVPLLSLRVSVSSHASALRPEFLKPAAGRHPAGYVLVS